MTQKNLIKEYCRLKGKIIPAKLKDTERAICGEWIGITAIRRCEEMALAGNLYRWPNEGKFAVFSLTPPPTPYLAPNLTPRTIAKDTKTFCCLPNWKGQPHALKCKYSLPVKQEPIKQASLF